MTKRGRAAITAEAGGKQLIYTAGNAGNGGNPQPDGVILGAGAQLITPAAAPDPPGPGRQLQPRGTMGAWEKRAMTPGPG